MLERRKSKSKSRFVFPGTGETGYLVEPKRGWKALLKRAGLDSGYRLHDLRRTMGSRQAMTGASGKIIGASLGHKTEQATAVYTKLTLGPILDSMARAVSEIEMTGKTKTSE